MDSLKDIGIKYNCDKITYHRYDRIYEKFFESIRNDNLKLFEIGCTPQALSVKVWLEYFPNTKIYGMDLDQSIETDRVSIMKGDQSNLSDLQRAIEIVGSCDIIIDDGSHYPKHQIDTFNHLFNHMLKNGGIYIIEDIECNYWRIGSKVYDYELCGDLNIIDFFSSTPHRINEEYSKFKNFLNISSITHHRNCIIIQKKDDEEIEESTREYRFKSRI